MQISKLLEEGGNTGQHAYCAHCCAENDKADGRYDDATHKAEFRAAFFTSD